MAMIWVAVAETGIAWVAVIGVAETGVASDSDDGTVMIAAWSWEELTVTKRY